MDGIKLFAGVTSSIVIGLIAVCLLYKSADKTLYDRTVETLRLHHGLSDSQEVLNRFPELDSIQLKLDRIADLNKSIHGITAGPAPNVSQEQEIYIQECTSEINQLRKSVETELIELLPTSTGYTINLNSK